MSFDKETRNNLARTVAACRRLLIEDVTQQLRGSFGLHPDGTVLPVDKLTHLTVDQTAAAHALRELIDHYAAMAVGRAEERRGAAYDRLVLEIAFTTLNRLAALRLCEERGLVVECVRKGPASDGFRLFERVAGGALGTRYATYRVFLECMFDELAVDLGVLFDRSTPQSTVFPSERCFEGVLAELGKPEFTHLWSEDETIGWIYQYFNPPEERKAMREASQAPRNSRELAVRNQFFTPRYVVEFLTDNTLGRVWYEMRKGDTALKDDCRYLVRRPNELFLKPGEAAPTTDSKVEDSSQEELLRQPVYIEHRPKKDPRDLKVLDPACGSGHFLLYSFDLLETIYEEAWRDDESPESEVTGRTLREDYSSVDELKRDAPKCILEWNLHGVDIDPRAVQIAALAVWLRAQNSWQRAGRKASARPRVKKSNIVCAEPMPEEPDMLKEFIETLRPRVLGEIIEVVFERMELAGEAGSLLKIDEDIRETVAEAKKQWAERPAMEQTELFPVFRGIEQKKLGFDLSGITDKEFWDKTEERIIEALKHYAEGAENGDTLHRRLFVDDAARGFGFIDICRRRYDVVLMNPPFGTPTESMVQYLKSKYCDFGGDILAAFLSRAVGMEGMPAVGAITSRAPFYLPSYSRWRRNALFDKGHVCLFGDLGANVLDDALVEAICVVVAHTEVDAIPSFRLNRAAPDRKGAIFLECIEALGDGTIQNETFLPTPQDLLGIPSLPIVYSAAHQLRQSLDEGSAISPQIASVQQGLSTKDDFRYLRLAVEVPADQIQRTKWGYIAKGGEYQPYYSDVHLVVKAHADFKELAADLVAKYPYLKGDPSWVLHPEADYFAGGLTYPERTTSSFSPRVLPRDCYFSHVGLGIVSGSMERDLSLLGWLLTRPVQLQIELQVGSADAVESGSAARHYNKALIEALRIPKFGALAPFNGNIATNIMTLRSMDEGDEVARYFISPWAGVKLVGSLSKMARTLYELHEQRVLDVLCRHEVIEKAAESVFGSLDEELLREEVRAKVTSYPDGHVDEGILEKAYLSTIENLADRAVEELGAHRSLSKKAFVAERRLELVSTLCRVHPASVVNTRRKKGIFPRGTVTDFVERVLSYLVGCIYGRWDVRIVLDESRVKSFANSDPFESLPCVPPGALLEGEGDLSLSQHGAEDARIGKPIYPLDVAWDGIVIDDIGWAGAGLHKRDIIHKLRQVIALLWDECAETIEREACEILGVSELREYFRKPTGFFQDHLKRYSKSRRKAPIYWPLSTASGSYTVWIYYHRLTDQTLYTVVNKYLEPKIAEVERGINRVDDAIKDASGREATRLRDRLSEGRALLAELRDLREELMRIAALPYKPDLNDGVIINAAPLHKVFRLRTWAKDTADCWKKLSKGDYDWTHLAYKIWPDRVREACKNDRSIAIAHGLEDLCDVEPPATKGKRKPRKRNEAVR